MKTWFWILYSDSFLFLGEPLTIASKVARVALATGSNVIIPAPDEYLKANFTTPFDEELDKLDVSQPFYFKFKV